MVIKNKLAREKLLKRIFLLIKRNPGIRPSKLNGILKIAHTSNLRDTLIKRGLVTKKKTRNAVYYYIK